MSKLADYNTPDSRVTVFAEELKEISKTSKLTPELIDIVMEPYTTMIKHCGLLTFERDEEKIQEILDKLDLNDIHTTEELMEEFDEAGIDYIFDHSVIF